MSLLENIFAFTTLLIKLSFDTESIMAVLSAFIKAIEWQKPVGKTTCLVSQNG